MYSLSVLYTFLNDQVLLQNGLNYGSNQQDATV